MYIFIVSTIFKISTTTVLLCSKITWTKVLNYLTLLFSIKKPKSGNILEKSFCLPDYRFELQQNKSSEGVIMTLTKYEMFFFERFLL